MNSELLPLTLTIKVKLAFKLQQFLKKIELFFTTPSNLKCELINYWISAGGGGWRTGGGGETPVFCECKKRPSLVEFMEIYGNLGVNRCTFCNVTQQNINFAK